MSITLEQVKKSEEITSYIRKADESLSALGFTEHSFAHVGLVSAQASAILKTLGLRRPHVRAGRHRGLAARHRKRHQPHRSCAVRRGHGLPNPRQDGRKP